ncbi:Abi family protein [Serratia rubidaea]|uniref:Abi family protein n=1 Tax=Serratia rubidaea TaxID=61652 RepID=UPI002DBDA131|nr:Abi family protein [Serratia rubidaea]MEB7588360.1 Abi family protein [Serratia rubidaea]
MPDSVAYQPDLMDRIFTSKRMHSYQRVFGNLPDREMVGVYIWNQTLGGELYPLLSAAEITLRNAIDSAFISFSGTRWWKKVKYKSYVSSPNHKIPFEIKAMKDNFSKSASFVTKEKHKRYNKIKYAPTHGEIVASSDFSTWEFAMSDELLGPGLFWFAMITQVFKGQWPSQSSSKTLTMARDMVKTIREYRNRVAHNEPLWKAYNVKNQQDAINYINKKIDTVEGLIKLLSPEKHDLLTKHNLFSNVRRVNSLYEINRFRTTGNELSLNDFEEVKLAFQSARDTNSSILCRIMPEHDSYVVTPR